MKDQMTHAEAISVIAAQQETINSLRQQLAESQAREKVLQEMVGRWLGDEGWRQVDMDAYDDLCAADSTALNEAIKQAQREKLLEAAKFFDTRVLPYPEDHLRRMADELDEKKA